MKMKMKNLMMVGAAAILAAAGVSQAAPLLPGTGIVGAPDLHIAGTLVDVLLSPVTSGTISGTLLSQVFLSDPANPFGPGNLTFVYTLTNDPTSDALERFNITNYRGYLTDAGFEPIVPPASAPSTITRSTILQDNGDLIGFNFDDAFGRPSLQAGATTILVVHTNAQLDGPVISNVIDGSVAQPLALAPFQVPEPASLGLLSVGGLLVLRKKR